MWQAGVGVLKGDSGQRIPGVQPIVSCWATLSHVAAACGANFPQSTWEARIPPAALAHLDRGPH